MEINRSNIFEILNVTGTKPSKDFGQNFLIEPSICERISNVLETDSLDNILEIGPGLGSLTHFINQKNGSLDCVDVDSKMIYILNELYKNESINFINDDIRNVSLDRYTKIIGNLPYNITTELIVHLLCNAKNCREFVFMIQAEALNRFTDVSGKEYGPASILVHLLGNIKKEFVVKAGSFYPAPKCNSVVFKITKNSNNPLDIAVSTYKLAKKLFLNRRKTLYNNLSNVCGKEKAIFILQKLGISDNARPEEIAPQRFVDIYFLTK